MKKYHINFLFEPIQFFLYITGIVSRSPKTSQFAVGRGVILLKLYGCQTCLTKLNIIIIKINILHTKVSTLINSFKV